MPSLGQEFETAPSIFELFHSAKKLLSLQTRVENRQLRKDNYSTQKNQVIPNPDNKVLDLLSPLSIDDLKSSPTYKQNSNRTGDNNMRQTKQNNSMDMDITPSSMIDSPSNGSAQNGGLPDNRNMSLRIATNLPGHSTNGAGWPADKTIKKEPSITLSNVHIPSSNMSNPLISGYPSKSNMPPILNPLPKSNLTSSLSKQKQEEKSSTSNGSDNNNEAKPTECSNCRALKTPLWRKDPQGNTLCNACGLFLKLHGTTRPLSLKTDVIKKRSSRRASNTPNKNSNPNFNPSTSLSRQNSTHEQFSNRNKTGFNSIPISSQQNHSSFSSANSTPSSANNGFLSSSGGIPINGNNASRYKNVLILPKPPASNTPNTPNNVSNSLSMNTKSIPTPSNSYLNGDNMTSPASPLVGGSLSSSQINNYNQQQIFKRKKSEANGNDNYMSYESFSKKNPQQMPLSTQNIKRNPSISSSFQSSSLNKRSSYTNLTSLQRKNSSLGLSNSLNNININANNQSQTDNYSQNFTSNSFSGNNSLTPSNINILNQRFSNTNTGGYFDNSNSFPRTGSNTGLNNAYVDTPGSVASQSSFSSSHIAPNRQSFTIPSELAPFTNPNPKTPVELLLPLEPLPSTTIPEHEDMDTDDFFKNYTELHNDDNDAHDFNLNAEKMGNRYEIRPTSYTKSTLTDGLKNQRHASVQHPNQNRTQHQSPSQNDSTSEMRDLDWLKFDI